MRVALAPADLAASQPCVHPTAVHRLFVPTALIAAIGAATWLSPGGRAEVPPQPLRTLTTVGDRDGHALYDRYCLACHGHSGDGKGPGAPWVWPRPRSFVRGEYKWRTTPSGKPPTDADLRKAIRYGVPGTSMHAFGATLRRDQVDALVEVLKGFAPRKFERDATPIDVAKPAELDALLGRAKYVELGCHQCHGEDGKGDGPSAAGLMDARGLPAPPYDLTSVPLRRPRAAGEDAITAIYTSLVTGLTGSAMPGYDGAAPAEDLWAVAAYVDSIRLPDAPGRPLNHDSRIPQLARQLDQKNRLRAGYYPGKGPGAVVFADELPMQGDPPAGLTPAEASLDARQCARCHAAQYRQWTGSLHATAGSPGLIGQVTPMEHTRGRSLQSCQRCHTPLAEQAPVLSAVQRGEPTEEDYERNPDFDSHLRDQGLNCAGCHVRGHQRFGPPRSTTGKRLPRPGYPLTELAIYERADFCLPCHQLQPRNGLNRRPLLNTYKEWLEGPYMRRGVQCQHCHMPDREHSFKGVHDPETFRQGIDVVARAERSRSGTVSARARITNVGAGHYLPTTPTPAAFVVVRLIDASGDPIEGARTEERIGRYLVYDGSFREIEDTRIPPGESFDVAGAWKGGRTEEARFVEVIVRVEPDEYYERLYKQRLALDIPAESKRLFRIALEKAQENHYTATRMRFPIRQAAR